MRWLACLGLVLTMGCTRTERRPAAPPARSPAPLRSVSPVVEPDTAAWFSLGAAGDLEAAAAQELYEVAGQPHYYVRFRVSNRGARPLGVDLRSYHEVLYPNQWGWSPEAQRSVIDETRAVFPPPTAQRSAELRAAFAAGALTLVPAHGALEFYRDFNASGRADVERDPAAWLLIALDGQLLASDGEQVLQLRVGDDEATRMLALPAPLQWRQVPAGAITLSDR